MYSTTILLKTNKNLGTHDSESTKLKRHHVDLRITIFSVSLPTINSFQYTVCIVKYTIQTKIQTKNIMNHTYTIA